MTSAFPNALLEHLQSGATTLCRCWGIKRQDGRRLGFTDHDCDLAFLDWTFRAGTGLTAGVMQQSTGLGVDNSEALGGLSDQAISEADIEAGKFDRAEVWLWLVNWQDVSQRLVQFRGTIGALSREGVLFRAELAGLTDALNRPLGRVYQKPCTAVLGDQTCRFDLSAPGYQVQVEIAQDGARDQFSWESLEGFGVGWFAGGVLEVLTGPAEGLSSMIRRDRSENGRRTLMLWQPLRMPTQAGDLLRLTAGCDKQMETCRLKFNNLVNFQGFPDIPGEDWAVAVPKSNGVHSGGSRR